MAPMTLIMAVIYIICIKITVNITGKKNSKVGLLGNKI